MWYNAITLTLTLTQKYKVIRQTVSKMIITDITGIGDPFIINVNGKYYMYATSARDGFKYFTSENLTDWTCGGYCYKAAAWTENDYWAPEVCFNGGKYYMFYTARAKAMHSLRIGLAVAEKPEGPFIDAQDGPLFDFGYAAIDASCFTDDDGQSYLYYSRDCSENIINGVHTSEIYCVKFSYNQLKTIGEPIKLTTPDDLWETTHDEKWRWNEGPAVIKHNGVYYLNYSVNCFDSRAYSVGCATSNNPLGPFKKYGDNPILKYREGEFSGPGHNCFFFGNDGQLYTAFHIHTNYDKPSGDRRACIAKVKFTDAGKLTIEI